jgi:PEP-CTERM motif
MKGLEKLGGREGVFTAVVLGTICLGAAQISQAQVYTMADNNSVATVDVGSPAGMSSWVIDNRQSYLNQQWFWYRLTGVGAAAPINAISAATVTTPYGLGGRALSVSYATSGYNLRVDYLLSGGSMGSGVSDIGETITINNTGNTSLSFHLFQYSDFNLSLASDTVQLGRNLRGMFNEAYQNDNTPTQPKLTETVISPGANHGEAALVGATLAELSSASFTTLNDNAGPVGPADVTWAFEWDLSIGPGGSAIISKDKYLNIGAVPEPSSLALLALGAFGCVWARRKKN